MFQSTIGSSRLSNDEKLAHLRTKLVGSAKRALQGVGYSGAMYDTAWQTLQRKFGQPHLIVSAQLSRLKEFSQIKKQDFKMLVEFADVVAHFFNVLLQFGYSNDLFSSTNLDVAVSKIPPEAKRRWFAHIENKSATKNCLL